ncbi:MAG TPA: xanthine dehydrogenase family protein subunit M [Desulfobacterales bacterium]|nr:xanthine dehydrogenase family protein subunit M [Desulfobacterales bacterium]
MIAKTEYHRPQSLTAALSLLGKYGKDLKILAGGTNLVVNLKEKTIQPKIIMDIKDLAEMSGIKIDDNGEGFIGPLATVSFIKSWCISHGSYDNLRTACQHLGSFQVRNRATVGGNLCDGSPCADTAIALLTYDAKLVVNAPGQERNIALDHFFNGIGGVDLRPDEILTQITIPKLIESRGEAFYKLGYRKAMTIAIAGVAVLITPEQTSPERIKDVRIALSSVAPIPMRAQKAENFLVGQQWGKELFEEAANMAAGEAAPITDLRATKEYRRKMIRTMVNNALIEAWDKAKMKFGDSLE